MFFFFKQKTAYEIYQCDWSSDVCSSDLDTRGQLVKTLVSDHAVAGDHTARWNGVDERGRAVASGIYFYRLEAGNYVQTRKMVLTK